MHLEHDISCLNRWSCWRSGRGCFGVESFLVGGDTIFMSRVQQIETELGKLSPAELQQIRDWLDEVLEEQLEFTDEFEAQIKKSEEEMRSGQRPRVR